MKRISNEDKANEICRGQASETDYVSSAAYNGAIEMAEWKDQEFLRLIDSKLDYARSKIEERHNKVDRIKYEGMRKILLEIRTDIEK